VVNLLQYTAAKSQAQAKGILDAAGMKYQTFMAGNEIYVWQGEITTANAIAELPEVESIRETRAMLWKIDFMVDQWTLMAINALGNRCAYKWLPVTIWTTFGMRARCDCGEY
jgi:hypothetical protein